LWISSRTILAFQIAESTKRAIRNNPIEWLPIRNKLIPVMLPYKCSDFIAKNAKNPHKNLAFFALLAVNVSKCAVEKFPYKLRIKQKGIVGSNPICMTSFEEYHFLYPIEKSGVYSLRMDYTPRVKHPPP
jgi:hypothetical protein